MTSYLWASNLLTADLRLFAIFGFEHLVAGARVLECIYKLLLGFLRSVSIPVLVSSSRTPTCPSKPYYRGKPDAARQSLDHLKLPEPEPPNRYYSRPAASLVARSFRQ